MHNLGTGPRPISLTAPVVNIITLIVIIMPARMRRFGSSDKHISHNSV